MSESVKNADDHTIGRTPHRRPELMDWAMREKRGSSPARCADHWSSGWARLSAIRRPRIVTSCRR